MAYAPVTVCPLPHGWPLSSECCATLLARRQPPPQHQPLMVACRAVKWKFTCQSSGVGVATMQKHWVRRASGQHSLAGSNTAAVMSPLNLAPAEAAELQDAQLRPGVCGTSFWVRLYG